MSNEENFSLASQYVETYWIKKEIEDLIPTQIRNQVISKLEEVINNYDVDFAWIYASGCKAGFNDFNSSIHLPYEVMLERIDNESWARGGIDAKIAQSSELDPNNYRTCFLDGYERGFVEASRQSRISLAGKIEEIIDQYRENYFDSFEQARKEIRGNYGHHIFTEANRRGFETTKTFCNLSNETDAGMRELLLQAAFDAGTKDALEYVIGYEVDKDMVLTSACEGIVKGFWKAVALGIVYSGDLEVLKKQYLENYQAGFEFGLSEG